MARKKSLSLPSASRRAWIEACTDYSVRRQCRLAGIPRSSFYYDPVPETEENLNLMRRIDEQYMRHPEYGYPRMTDWLREEGWDVGHKRVARLMQLMRLQAITPGPHTSRPAPEHVIYPYLLRGVQIERVNQIWSTDITYVPMKHGYMYLVAVMDWYSRYVLSWELSNSLDSLFCVTALERALAHGTPEVFNTDQGSQFTSEAFTHVLLDKQIAISMDGRGRALDNVFIERLWWTVKYEDIYPHVYADGRSLYDGLARFFAYYNNGRNHSMLDKQTPSKVFLTGKNKK